MPGSASDDVVTPGPEGPYLLRWSERAMLRLALSSACTIASLLCIPDGIGIIPDVHDFFVWLVRMIGLWLSGFYLWTIGFLCVLYLGRWLTRGIELDGTGVKLWRFGKRIPWQSFRAAVCEPQPFFSRAFCLYPTVHKLTLYFDKRTARAARRAGGGPPEIGWQSIGSMYLSAADFESLLVFISQHAFDFIPDGLNIALATPSGCSVLHKAYAHSQHMRVFASCLILSSLVLFLARKTALNFSYNEGVREFRLEHYANSRRAFAQAATVDATFAPAWDYLARSEYRLGLQKNAERDWRRALAMQPDMVEAKIGLSNVLAKRGELDEAMRLLRKALRLSPTNLSARINLSDVLWRMGKRDEAINTIREVIELDPDNLLARTDLARMLADSGRVAEAKTEIASARGIKRRLHSDADYYRQVSRQVASAAGAAYGGNP